mmetsp:Transcript_69160/g.186936  ORF Transcript_69160/g.186936 Transcript_69160/m.186936 type:complete len:223 (+) Transcript_69160:219-887(+)
MAQPRTLGQELRFTRYLWKLLPALSTGLSMRPPPATMPTMARQVDGMVFRVPLGRRTRVLRLSSECPTTMQDVPDARAILPRSDAFSSHIETTVPSGILPTGITLPTASWALDPQYTNWPVCSPSTATISSLFSLYRYWSWNTTSASGAPRPGSWMMFLTSPLMYPARSAKSWARSFTAPFRRRVFAVKIKLLPFRDPRMTRPMASQLLERKARASTNPICP